jgi:predicted TIM-barrel enzyme
MAAAVERARDRLKASGLSPDGRIERNDDGTLDEIAGVAKGIRDDVILLCHGGPIAEPDDAAFILRNCPAVDGFYGASSMERLPTETAIANQVRGFAGLRTGGKKG